MVEGASGIRSGLIGEAQMTVTEAVSAAHLGSGNVHVLGMEAKAWAEVVDVVDRRVSLQVEAYDEVEKIGEGTIQRVIVDRDRFTEHVARKSPAPDQSD
jgi:fluoroacetyl-CoA thioesterase